MMEIHISKTCVIFDTACTGWSYDTTYDITQFHLKTGKVLTAKGNWIKHLRDAHAKGAVATNGKILTYRQ
jgi:hypothetical protein